MFYYCLSIIISLLRSYWLKINDINDNNNTVANNNNPGNNNGGNNGENNNGNGNNNNYQETPEERKKRLARKACARFRAKNHDKLKENYNKYNAKRDKNKTISC